MHLEIAAEMNTYAVAMCAHGACSPSIVLGVLLKLLFARACSSSLQQSRTARSGKLMKGTILQFSFTGSIVRKLRLPLRLQH